MNLKAFRDEHQYCELAPLFRTGRFECVVPQKPQIILKYPVEAGELHHVVGRTKRGRTNDERNLLHLSHWMHAWATQYSLAGRVASCWALKQLGRLDWKYLSSLDGPKWPGLFETDLYVAQCSQFETVERMRRSLCR